MQAKKLGFNNRQRQILSLVRSQGFQSVDTLSRHFSVTPQTIRRDVNLLCEHKLLNRHHGGVDLSSSVENTAYQTRQVLYQPQKRKIAELAARYIPNNASLFINIGTTTEEIAIALRSHRGLRVITNNLNVVTTLRDSLDCELIIAGGVVRSHDGGITGEATSEFIRQFQVDYGIIGISGIDQHGNLLDYDYHEVCVARAILESSRHVFLVADHTKFGRSALVRLGSLDDVQDLFTDQAPPDEFMPAIEQANVRLHLANKSFDKGSY